MTDKTCGNCMFWGKPGETEMFRQCNGVIHDERSYHNEEIGDWMDDDEKESFRHINSLSAVVVDGSGYFAALKTKEDFGCTLFREASE